MSTAMNPVLSTPDAPPARVRGRLQLLLLLLVAIGPMILATAMYQWRFWVPDGRNYHGTLIGDGTQLADIGVQVHGGMGYVEETGAAQYLRDVRITPIYEGTNGIQAMDLVGRKLAQNGGRAVVTPVSLTLRPVAWATRRAVGSAEWRPCEGPMPTVEKRLTSCTSR